MLLSQGASRSKGAAGEGAAHDWEVFFSERPERARARAGEKRECIFSSFNSLFIPFSFPAHPPPPRTLWSHPSSHGARLDALRIVESA